MFEVIIIHKIFPADYKVVFNYRVTPPLHAVQELRDRMISEQIKETFHPKIRLFRDERILKAIHTIAAKVGGLQNQGRRQENTRETIVNQLRGLSNTGSGVLQLFALFLG